ncbi:MAG: hypothetical protein HY881_10750 [Deltaproteobacteria bacterium]|nr:hypothetical protein [Deltaproteobacteria bacterium]
MKVNRIFFALFVIFIVTSYGDDAWSLEFPFDHGPHFDARSEWWYFSGEILTVEGKTLGFECTIFKEQVNRRNAFAFIGHVAVSDPENVEHIFSETITYPPVPDIEEGKPVININDFSYSFSETEGFIKVQGRGENLNVDVDLYPLTGVLPHGEDGVIVMGDGRDSYYYSYTNLATTGNITLKGIKYAISSGHTWMDHQWGNFTVFGDLWDWFSLRFDDGGALMLFRFRNIFGDTVRSNWTYQSASGEVYYGEPFMMQAKRTYTDENGNCEYPVDWTVAVSNLDAIFAVKPLFDAQALYDVTTPDYWEGLCSFDGCIAGKKVSGSAYVELTGYCSIPFNSTGGK